MGPVIRKPVVLFVGVCCACLLLMYYQSSGFHGKPHHIFDGTCTIDAMNTVIMEQDDPCILNLLRKNFLFPPSKEKMTLEQPDVMNPSMGQAQSILEILNNKRKGFFIECGALDGEIRSNTLYMERELEWEGILIEADPENYKKVVEKHRKAWTVPACLSTSTSPQPVTFKQNFNQGRISQNQLEDLKEGGSVKVQCFPIYSILSALNRTTVDYFSLDIEGDELAVLKTIPWNHVHIQTLSVEFIHDKEGKDQIKEFMSNLGYEVVKEVTDPNWLANDFIFNKI